VPYRLGVNVSCSATNEDSRAGKEDEVSIVATIARPGAPVESRRTRKFNLTGPSGPHGSFVAGVAEGDVAPGESVHVFLTFTEQDEGLPPAFLDLLAKAAAEATGAGAGDPAAALVNGLAGAFRGFAKDGDDVLGILAVKLTCSSKGDLVMETRPIYEAVEAAPHRLRDAAEEVPQYHRHELTGAGGHYAVESWVCYTQPPPPSTRARIEYMSHVAGIGDTAFVPQREVTGSERESRSMEGLSIRSAPGSEAIDLRVKAHLSFRGDTDWVGLGGFVGTRGESLAMEALWMELAGPSAERYDVWYSVRLADCDWMGWVKNGSRAEWHSDFA
jgi:Clostridial hydrophobic W